MGLVAPCCSATEAPDGLGHGFLGRTRRCGLGAVPASSSATTAAASSTGNVPSRRIHPNQRLGALAHWLTRLRQRQIGLSLPVALPITMIEGISSLISVGKGTGET